MVPVVQEFYASLWDQKFKRTEGYTWETIIVKGKDVRITPWTIWKFYNIPFYEKYFVEETNLD